MEPTKAFISPLTTLFDCVVQLHGGVKQPVQTTLSSALRRLALLHPWPLDVDAFWRIPTAALGKATWILEWQELAGCCHC